MAQKLTITPIMDQYQEMKKKHPDAMLLFRIGDFYECYKQDAQDAIDICGTDYKVFNTDDYGDVVYTRFPHHALDTYLPKLVRAGKRVAICEQLENDKKKVVEDVKPAETEEPKPEPKPEKKMNKTKEINCTLSTEQLRDLGEPVAYFTMTIPKEAKSLGKQTAKDRANLEAICVQPERGKMIASDTHILTAMDVKCEGTWPEDKNGMPFECFIDAKAISSLAGKQVDVAVWADNRGDHFVTACEAVGVLAQYQLTGVKYPDWKRVIPSDNGVNIVIAESALEPLRKFVKTHMGKNKTEQKNRFAVLHVSKDADDVLVSILEREEEYSNEYTTIAQERFDLSGGYPEKDIQMSFCANLFYYSVQEDFNGSIWIRNECSSVKFYGEMRRSVLMPTALCGVEAYMK